jgi:hypothetical protein
MRPELKLYFAGLDDQPGTVTTSERRPYFAVCLMVLDKDGGHLESRPVEKFPRSYDAMAFASDLAKSPDAVEAFRREHRLEKPSFIVVQDCNGRELSGSRKPILGIRPERWIGVFRAVFVKDMPADWPPFDVAEEPLLVFEADEVEMALDVAENRARERFGALPWPNGLVVKNHRGKELGRFLTPEPKAVAKPTSRTPWLWRMLGWGGK